ncbi:MAG: hypothetical protein NTW30_04860 [Candidatus Aenigmarchaeota archaeon]|nr:hypothetical protein [Candidatus Aenigmarchaeota archaeon]
MSEDNVVLSKWAEIKQLCEALEMDVAKNARGVVAAGVRLRKGLRAIQKLSREFVKLTVERDKESKPEKG